MQRIQVRFTGQVQGVGFRYATQRAAQGHAVSGWVRNEADGSVLLVAEGDRAALEAFMSEHAMRLGHLRYDEARDESAGTGEFSGFEIRY